MKPSVLIFDLGNVLWQLDYTGWLSYIRTFNHSITEAALSDFVNIALFDADERNVPDDDYLINYRNLLQRNGLSMEQAYDIHSRLLAKGPTEAMAILPSLKKHYRLFLISNINPWHRRYVEKTHSHFAGYFEKRIYSYEAEVKKPSPAIFDYFRGLTGVDFAEAIFFDDMKENVDAAIGLGLESILVTSDAEFCPILKNKFLGYAESGPRL
jgi:glucose-1-phosphatase